MVLLVVTVLFGYLPSCYGVEDEIYSTGFLECWPEPFWAGFIVCFWALWETTFEGLHCSGKGTFASRRQPVASFTTFRESNKWRWFSFLKNYVFFIFFNWGVIYSFFNVHELYVIYFYTLEVLKSFAFVFVCLLRFVSI